MPRHVVSRSQTLTEIHAALAQLVRDYEAEATTAWPACERVAAERLAAVLRVDEALGLVKLIRLERIRCDACGSCVPTTKAAGSRCIWCASKILRAAEANQQEQQ